MNSLNLIPKNRDPRLALHAVRFGLPAGGDGLGDGDDGLGGSGEPMPLPAPMPVPIPELSPMPEPIGIPTATSGYFTDRVGFWRGGDFGYGRGRFGRAGGWWGGGWWPERFWEQEHYPWYEAGPWIWGSMPWNEYEDQPCPDYPWLGYCPPLASFNAFDWRAFEY